MTYRRNVEGSVNVTLAHVQRPRTWFPCRIAGQLRGRSGLSLTTKALREVEVDYSTVVVGQHARGVHPDVSRKQMSIICNVKSKVLATSRTIATR